MGRETDYYIAKGRSLEAVERYQKEALAHRENGRALQTQLDAQGIFEIGNQVVGFAYDRNCDLPKGLRWDKKNGHRGMAVPDRRLKEGKAIQKRLESPACPSSWDFNHWILGDKAMYVLGPHPNGHSSSIGIVGFEHLGGDWVLKVPVPDKGKAPAPIDAEPMKRSEYWARKEAQQEAAAV